MTSAPTDSPREASSPYDRRLALAAEGAMARLNALGVLDAADVHVATTLARVTGEKDEACVLAAAFATRGVRQGSVAIDVHDVRDLREVTSPLDSSARDTPDLARPGTADSEEADSESGGVETRDADADDDGPAETAWTDLVPGISSATDWLERVRESRLVAQGALVVEHDLVYLQRYHEQEVAIVRDLRERAARPAPVVDEGVLATGLERVFPGETFQEQRAAAQVVLHAWTSVLTGGPGTGKTTSVAGVLALLADHAAVRGDRPLRVGLAAPTGKAAARMQEAVAEALGGILARTADPATRAVIERLSSVPALTLHRLLGRRPDSSTRFRHDRTHRLPHDVVLVDESSMVSLTHMARLLEALRPTTRLILVGDADQLVSVDAGAVLADLVAGVAPEPAGSPADPRSPRSDPAAEPDPDAATRRVPAPVPSPLPASGPASALGPTPPPETPPVPVSAVGTPIAVARLRTAHRFGRTIGDLAEHLLDGDADAVIAQLGASIGAPGAPVGDRDRAVEWIPEPDPAAHLRARLTRRALAIRSAALAGDADGALDLLEEHRLLCAHREGPHGVRSWNARIEAWLTEETGDPLYDPMYVGRPLLVTRNDYATGVFNGDTGVIVAEPGTAPIGAQASASAGTARARHVAVIRGSGPAHHPRSSPDGASLAAAPGSRDQRFGPSRLGDVETMHAMTIHKAQGSQAREVTVLLPGEESPLLTRELLYTAVTRAQERVVVAGSEAAVRAAVGRRVVRASGLRQRLREGS